MVTPPKLTELTHPSEPVYLQVIAYNGMVITKLPFWQVKQLFQRALNTWSDVPAELLNTADQLEKL